MDQDTPTVLVIEDDHTIQALIEDGLADGGFFAAIAPSGEEAVTLLKAHPGKYQAIITDINLSGRMDGWEIARRAREISAEFPVVYISGASAVYWPSKGVPNSIMFAKPFAVAQLVTAVSQLLKAGSTPTAPA